MSAVLAFRCHACKARIKAPIKLLGQVRPCPRCKQSVRVRIQPPEDSPPALVLDKAVQETDVLQSLER